MTRRRSRWLAAAVVCGWATAQPGAERVAVSGGRLRADLEFLCADTLEGRLSLGHGAEVAARYIASEFQRSGLAPAAGTEYLQEFPLAAYEPDRARTKLSVIRGEKSTAFRYGSDFRGGHWREATVRGGLVFAGFGITAPEYGYDDYAGIDARGKVVLVFDHEPQENDPRSRFNGTGHTYHGNSRIKAENARKHGAVALLIASEPRRGHAGAFDAAPQTTTTPLRANAPRQTIEDDSIPVVQVSDSAAAALLAGSGKTPAVLQAAINRTGRPASTAVSESTVELSTAPANLRRGHSLNAVGLLEGSDEALRGETVLITGHYDHLGVQNGRLYPGANDNASGSVAVMELARIIREGPWRPRRSLLFAVFGSEEEGLLGSYYYAAHPLRPLKTTRAVLNLDMIGRDEAHIPQSKGVVEIPADTHNSINLVGAFYSPELRKTIEEANRRIGLEISDKFDRDHDLNVLFRCDHFPFVARGVPAVWFFGGFHPGYHEPSDTIEKLNFPKMTKVVELAYWTARATADR